MNADFSAPGVDLYCGDSALVLPQIDATFDLLATDPPYGVAFKSHHRTDQERFPVIHGDRGEVDVAAIVLSCVLKLRRKRHVYVFGPSEPVRAIERLTAHATLIWDKEQVGMGNLGLPWGPAHETINFAVTELSKANREDGRGRLSARLRQGSVIRSHRPNSAAITRHPTEKPVDLMRQLIESSTCIGDLVIDPFMGSGSTVVAALLAGRRAIGIEIDPKYFAVAKGRVEAVLSTLKLLEAA